MYANATYREQEHPLIWISMGGSPTNTQGGLHVYYSNILAVSLLFVLCTLRQHSLSSLLQMMVVDGDSGSIVWSYSAPCHMKESPTTSAVTSERKSVFLFWAEGLSAAPPNSVSEPGRSLFCFAHDRDSSGLTGVSRCHLTSHLLRVWGRNNVRKQEPHFPSLPFSQKM